METTKNFISFYVVKKSRDADLVYCSKCGTLNPDNANDCFFVALPAGLDF
jgi:uncharacterized Zn finger protein